MKTWKRMSMAERKKELGKCFANGDTREQAALNLGTSATTIIRFMESMGIAITHYRDSDDSPKNNCVWSKSGEIQRIVNHRKSVSGARAQLLANAES